MKMRKVNKVLCVVCMLCLLGHCACSCDFGLEDYVNWAEDPSNVTITVDTSVQEECSLSGECLIEENNNTSILQIPPVIVQGGVQIRMLLMSDLSVRSLLRVERAHFATCDFNNTTPIPTTLQNDSLSIESKDLTDGSNYILFGTTDDCNRGNRINITVVTKEDCGGSSLDELCNGNGMCTTNKTTTSFTCKCCADYKGQYCESSTTRTKGPCGDRECANGGTCVPVASGDSIAINSSFVPKDVNETVENAGRCACNPHFTGPNCETRLDHCKSSPCVHGVCVERIDGFQCYCIPGFHGNQCQLEYNECLSNPCSNGGTCIDRVDQYECRCTLGFNGRNCKTKVNLCDPYPCHKNSTCIDHGNMFSCHCHHGYTGRLCDIRLDDCVSNPCQNHGTCKRTTDGYRCLCPLTFAGVHCEYMMDVFAPPLEGSDVLGKSHNHNFYIVAGTLSSAIVVILVVLVACYCKMHETYRQITWRRLRNSHRSLSCPDFDSCNEGISSRQTHRLSVDAICEATSLSYNNPSMESSLRQPLNSHKI